jgi:hypothetical protein
MRCALKNGCVESAIENPIFASRSSLKASGLLSSLASDALKMSPAAVEGHSPGLKVLRSGRAEHSSYRVAASRIFVLVRDYHTSRNANESLEAAASNLRVQIQPNGSLSAGPR